MSSVASWKRKKHGRQTCMPFRCEALTKNTIISEVNLGVIVQINMQCGLKAKTEITLNCCYMMFVIWTVRQILPE